jgi:hypothetical protein
VGYKRRKVAGPFAEEELAQMVARVMERMYFRDPEIALFEAEGKSVYFTYKGALGGVSLSGKQELIACCMMMWESLRCGGFQAVLRLTDHHLKGEKFVGESDKLRQLVTLMLRYEEG